MATRSTIAAALGGGMDGLTSLQQALVNFADKMHDRLQQHSPGVDDEKDVIENNNTHEAAADIFKRMVGQLHQMMEAKDTEVHNETATVDMANLSFITD